MTIQAREIHVRGVVQGVGFRPFVYQQALKNGLTGWVRNTSGDVTIVVEGEGRNLEKFMMALRASPPPESHIDSISSSEEPPGQYQIFEILESLTRPDEYQLISPDLATCSACRSEIFDPANRRYRYPFTNCTNCGPRFTIIEDIPYDRPRTTMRHFRMCPNCQKEYDDPGDRRFHAQPNACPVCGPRLELTDANGKMLPVDDIISEAARLIREGKITAIKGLGGFLLACDATNDEAVQRLRERKQRPAKPFAVMLKDLEEIQKYCQLSDLEAKTLSSAAAPIVLLRKIKGEEVISPFYERAHSNPPPLKKGEYKGDFPSMNFTPAISPSVAPGLNHLGVMLPYTPLHHLLIQETDRPLVMTSGNLSEEPIAKDNSEALARLGGIADYFILHNREIYSRYDDSVTMVEMGEMRVVRRARGYAPYPIHLPFQSRPVLACGAELKNTFCLTRDDHAFVSQHIGDLENAETLEHFENTVQLYQRLFRIQPEAISCDLHPDYLSTKWSEEEAKKRNLPLVRVQHHYAHIVSCMAENKILNPVIGVALDGTGYGTDGRIWGSEFMIADYQGFQRKAHLEYLPLPGGNAAIQKPYRTAIGYLYYLMGKEALAPDLPCFKGVDELEVELIKKQIDQNLNTPWTSSCGRLFDAISSLAGIRQQAEYEGQAAIELEAAAEEIHGETVTYPFQLDSIDGIYIIRVREILASVLIDLNRGLTAGIISAKFHNTMADIIIRLCSLLSQETGLKQAALSGGVFQNRRLLKEVVQGLRDKGLTPLIHSQLPSNDGCISLGQAVVASCQLRKNG